MDTAVIAYCQHTSIFFGTSTCSSMYANTSAWVVPKFLGMARHLTVCLVLYIVSGSCVCFCTLYADPRGFFSRSRLRGTQGGSLHTRRKFGCRTDSVARALRVQGAKFGSNHWVPFRGARAEHGNGKPTCQLKLVWSTAVETL